MSLPRGKYNKIIKSTYHVNPLPSVLSFKSSLDFPRTFTKNYDVLKMLAICIQDLAYQNR